MAMFKKPGFILRVALKCLKSELSGIISSFNTHAQTLKDLVVSEIFVNMGEIRKEQIENLNPKISRTKYMAVRDTLDANRQNEIAYHEELRVRTDDACQWIISDEKFSYWKLNSRDTNFCVLFGDMGCGKTMTTAYVVDVLKEQAPEKQYVCAYYCKDDQETTNLGNIYRSLIWQLLKREPALKDRFQIWYEENNSAGQVDATQSAIKLREFLHDTLSSSEKLAFIVLDGLDECHITPRDELLSLFRELSEQNARVKIFISSRYDDEIQQSLPPSASRIDLCLTHERSLMIAKHLATKFKIQEDIRDRVADELSQRANGCAIWLRIAFEFLKTLHIQGLKLMETELKRLHSYKTLTNLYWALFEKMCAGQQHNEKCLKRALETLAVAQRPLSLDELVYTVFIDINDNTHITIDELEEYAQSLNLLELIRPFISTIKIDGGKQIQLRLVHQSLKELILQAPPSEWNQVAQRDGKTGAISREAELHSNLLRRCVKYLLLDECERIDLSSSFKTAHEDEHLRGFNGFFDDDEDTADSLEIFNPFKAGLGRFFTYAASYWAAHMSDTSQELWLDQATFIKLCTPGSQRLENWVVQWTRSNCSGSNAFKSLEVMSQVDPVVVAAALAPVAYMTGLLKLHNLNLVPDSLWFAVKQLIERNCISTIHDILRDEVLGVNLRSTPFIMDVVKVWSDFRVLHGGVANEWEDLFDFLIRREELCQHLMEHGNEILCHAARHGFLILIKRLFQPPKSNNDLDLRGAILRKNRLKLRGDKGEWAETRKEQLHTHQSVGEAAYEGHVEIVRFLCEQPGIEDHLRHQNEHGRTVFHQAVRNNNKNIIEILIKHYPEGINIRDKGNDLPLDMYIFGHGSTIDAVETVKIMLTKGKADATGLNDDYSHSPLCTAIRKRNINLCELLTKEGSADMSCAVRVDKVTGEPFFIEEVRTDETMRTHYDEILKQLLPLLPSPIPAKYFSYREKISDARIEG
ncbi:hypothetical protein TrVFT333_006206 [Trichoderma virens FT-333]|nr:hypothetical protein TrVFT333_006206 [Trichoderma virens FT-333]